MIYKHIKIVAAFTALLFSAALYAQITQSVHLRDGTVLSGNITSQDRETLTIRTQTGLRTLNKNDIHRVTYESQAERQARQQREQAERERRAREARERAEREARERAERERIEQARAEELEREARERAEAEEMALIEREQAAMERAERAAWLREQLAEDLIDRPDEPVSYWDFAWRSLVIPGWGHRHIEKPVTGWLYTATGAALLYYALDTRAQAERAQQQNRDQVLLSTAISFGAVDLDPGVRTAIGLEVNRNALTTYDTRVNRHNQALGLLGAFYALQFTHILLEGLAWQRGELLSGFLPFSRPGQKNEQPYLDVDIKRQPVLSEVNPGKQEDFMRMGLTFHF